jgi:hypothetical protein
MLLTKRKLVALISCLIFLPGLHAEAAPADNAIEKADLERAWTVLAASNNAEALRSLLVLSRAPKDSVPFVSTRMKLLLSGEAPARITELIEDLDSPKFAVRDKAGKELEAVIEEAAPHLQKVLNGKPSLEVRRRVELLLSRGRAAEALWARQAQTRRALSLLEVIGSGPAREMLEAIARDAREEWLAKEAEAALKRLAGLKPTASWDDLTGTDPGAAARAFLMLSRAHEEGNAEPAQILAVLQLANQVPPLVLRSRGVTTRQLPHELLPYRKELLDRYKPDARQSPFRKSVEEALQILSKSETKDLEMNEEMRAQSGDELEQRKREIVQIQRDKIGDAFINLSRAAEELESLREFRDRECKFWQANYDYVLARLYARQACILEYSVMLGQVRRDALPTLDWERQKGWRLTAKDKLSDPDARELGDKAKKLLKEMIKEHQGTPWEVIARQEFGSPFGLMWVPLAK